MFLDINMPRMNGWEVLRRIVSDDIMQDIPVVMLSAEAEGYSWLRPGVLPIFSISRLRWKQ
ncbi:MAG: response regulator [Alphaproteobacteria bacterium]